MKGKMVTMTAPYPKEENRNYILGQYQQDILVKAK